MKRKIFRSEKLQEQFIEKGYVKVTLPDSTMLEKLKAEIADLHPDDQFNPVANKVNPLALQLHCTFLDTNLEYKKKAQELMLRYFQPVIDDFLINYSFISGNLFVKPCGEGLLHLHQNWAVTEYEHTCLTFWIPMHDVDVINGTLHVVEGSHKIVPYIPTPEQGDYFNRFSRELTEKHLTPVKLKFGEAVVFCESLIHGSPVNLATHPRVAMQIAVYPSECKPLLFKLTPEKDAFSAHQIDTDFFVNHSIEAAMQPTEEMTIVKQVPNVNKALDYDEFLFRMKTGSKHRDILYNDGLVVLEPFIATADKAPAMPVAPKSGWQRLLALLKN